MCPLPETASRSCLVHVFGSGNVLAALCAVKWYGLQRHGDERADVVTLAHNPGLSDDAAQESAGVVERMIASQGWPKPIVLTRGEMNEITQPGRWTSYSAVLHRFREKMGVGHFDEVYYTHDLVGRAAELAMNAYPCATRITFGDSMGTVRDRRYLQVFNVQQSHVVGQMGSVTCSLRQRMLNTLRACLRKMRKIIVGGSKPLQASEAVLILPVDLLGDYLDDKELLIVPKDLVQEIISDCNRANPELTQYSRDLIDSTTDPCYVILLENLSEGNFTSFERELTLYEKMVRRHVPQGATVLIKAHPLSMASTDEALSSRLQPDYDVRLVSQAFNRYPLELWSDLVSACQVITMGFCAITLAFLYDKSVLYAPNPSLIEEYISPRFRDHFKNIDRLQTGMLANLATWDGQSVLWKGSTP